jgi:hypothetical protein
MASTHLFVFNGLTGSDWSVSGAQVRNLWVWHSGAWVPIHQQSVWNGAWQLGFDDTPGPLDHIDVSPSSAFISEGSFQDFVATGFDADGRGVSITPDWAITTITDSIDSTGRLTAGHVADTGTVTATVGSISGSASYEVG